MPGKKGMLTAGIHFAPNVIFVPLFNKDIVKREKYLSIKSGTFLATV